MAKVGEILSRIVDIEEVVVETTSELTKKRISIVEEAFNNSNTYKKLYNYSNNYYKSDIELIVLDFIMEMGWREA